MADVSVKMGVSGIQQFRQGMKDAEASVKTLDAALKANEKALKSTGDAENYMQAQTSLLNKKLQEQKNIAQNAEQALKQMEANGVKTTSASYQNMQRKLIEAQSSMMDTQDQLNNLGNNAAEAAGKTDQLSTSLGGLNKKVSLEQVIGAIGKITDGMEKAGRKAIELGKNIWENITDSAKWADDVATQAMVLNMDVEDYQRYKKVFDTVGELTVAEWQKAKLKVQKAINDPSQEQIDILSALGISTIEWGTRAGASGPELIAKNFEDMFWEIGSTLKKKVENGELTQDLADTYANAIFGRGFAELNPMFALGKEGFTAALAEQNVVTEESINKLAALNDELIKLQGDFNDLKSEVLAGLAPSLQTAAETLDSLLGRLMEYLRSEDGQKALEDLGKAVSGLFDDLGNISPDQVVEGYAKVFNDIVTGMQWISDHWGEVKTGIAGIGAAFLAMKGMENVLMIIKLIDGLKGLGIGGNGGNNPVVTNAGENTAARFAVPASVNNAALNAGAWANATNMTNAGAVVDWFSHETEAGRWFQNQISKLFGGTEQYATDGPFADITKYFESVKKNWEDLTQGEHAGESFLDSIWNSLFGDGYGGGSHGFGDEGVEIPVEPVAPEDAASAIAGQVGTVTVPVSLVWDRTIGGAGGGMDWNVRQQHANGLWSVPFDGYAAILHKGEQVVPAREVMNSRNYSSNLYVESMYMNNGQDAEGLAAAIAAANRRTMRGYGS